eukprot:Amastigsp_a179153_14.p3 type:complete len:128 gc:universal Amastigsp_a179153_14:246-629(+)
MILCSPAARRMTTPFSGTRRATERVTSSPGPKSRAAKTRRRTTPLLGSMSTSTRTVCGAGARSPRTTARGPSSAVKHSSTLFATKGARAICASVEANLNPAMRPTHRGAPQRHCSMGVSLLSHSKSR